MRLYEIVGTCLIVLVLSIGCYLGGFWLWATPAKRTIVHGRAQVSPAEYVFIDTPTNRALGAIYSPIFNMQCASVAYFFELNDRASNKFWIKTPYRRINSLPSSNSSGLGPGQGGHVPAPPENPFALFDEFIEP